MYCVTSDEWIYYIFWKQKKNISFLAADDDNVNLKYSKIQKKNIKNLLSLDFDNQPFYDEKHIKTRVKTFEDKVITKFADNEIPKENTHYSCIAAICVDSVMKLEKESYLEVNLEQFKFRLKKKRNFDLFNDELEDSSDESKTEAE